MGMRASSWVACTGAALALAAVASAPAGAVSGPAKVLAGPPDQYNPSVNDTYLTWTQDSEAHPGRDNAYGKVLGATGRFRLNPAGTRGFSGALDPDQDRAIYQQVDGGESDLFTFDLDTRNRHKLGSPINTARWEWGPRVSNAFYLFARDAQGMTSLFLYRRPDGPVEKIESRDFTTYYTAPGEVGERYATWTVCGPSSCAAYVHDTTSADTTKIPTVPGKAQYAPVVDEGAGMLYFVRSGQGCGDGVGIWRRRADLSTPARRLVALPAGIDVGWQMSLDHEAARVDLWFSRFRCASRQGDIYKLRDIETLP
jgi:hypothetical protein